MTLDAGIASRLKRDANGLFTAIAQERGTGQVLMVAWMDDIALARTLETRKATYYSRSRGEHWVKGETSGHTQYVHSVRLDCNGDTVLLEVDQVGGACHTGDHTCFDNRIALVTGASSGIGRATALRLAQEGALVALVALEDDDLGAAAAECRATGSAALAIAADVGDPRQVAAAFERAETLGAVSAVFSNAGISIVGPATSLHDDDWLRQLRVNLSGSFYVVREAARRMLDASYGAIVTTGSELGLLGQQGYVGYAATKGGVLAMTRALAAELAPRGIRVNSVSPGTTDTPMLMAEFSAAPDPARERAENKGSVPLGRIGQPGDIAAAVAFLLSDEAAYITGANLVVDGGRTSCFSIGTLGQV